MTSLISPELGRTLALRRVRRGHVSRTSHDRFLDAGGPMPDYLEHYLRELLNGGYLGLGEPQRECDQRTVRLTSSGEQLRRTLERVRGLAGTHFGAEADSAASAAGTAMSRAPIS